MVNLDESVEIAAGDEFSRATLWVSPIGREILFQIER